VSGGLSIAQTACPEIVSPVFWCLNDKMIKELMNLLSMK
jgi:hypothetical protein